MGTIRDRGLVKWQAALIMPEHKALNKKIGEVDYFLNKKPVLDEYQVEEFENTWGTNKVSNSPANWDNKINYSNTINGQTKAYW
ncbi:hypothetical protein [Peribacillus frigoritolerans]|uniref:hypothetical protein n=1 Tax=Peribacillus frigoritolerans TaxID=450367 RepID=UPI002E1F9056|nr:hypothetical protein [Peribacillus frigoritolerans]MED3848412.1 hypothetical protein [Peribacillus frigoritolerans]